MHLLSTQLILAIIVSVYSRLKHWQIGAFQIFTSFFAEVSLQWGMGTLLSMFNTQPIHFPELTSASIYMAFIFFYCIKIRWLLLFYNPPPFSLYNWYWYFTLLVRKKKCWSLHFCTLVIPLRAVALISLLQSAICVQGIFCRLLLWFTVTPFYCNWDGLFFFSLSLFPNKEQNQHNWDHFEHWHFFWIQF